MAASPRPVAFATPARPTISSEQTERLNARLGNLLPQGGQVAYSQYHRTGSLHGEDIGADVLARIAPPKNILDRAVKVLYRRRTVAQADGVYYLLSRRHLLVADICTGWLVELHPLGGGPAIGTYTVGPCPSDVTVPAWAAALPTIPPHPIAAASP